MAAHRRRGAAARQLLYGTALYNATARPRPVTAYAFIPAPRRPDPANASRRPRAAMRSRSGARGSRWPRRTRPARPARARRRRAARHRQASGHRQSSGHRPFSPRRRRQWRIHRAFGQRATAEALFARLRGKLGARQAFYVAAGKVTRLQVGPYPTRAAAAAGCAALPGQACFPVFAR